MTHPEFREAYGRHKDVLYRFAWRMTGSSAAAEDVVQDCFLLLLRNGTTYDAERGALRSFLFGVTRNLALKRLRSERTFDDLDDGVAICEPLDAVGEERAELVAQAIAALPALQRDVLILAEYVKSRLYRARENLRRMLAPLLEMKGTRMDPERDPKLSELLKEWQLPGAPAPHSTRGFLLHVSDGGVSC